MEPQPLGLRTGGGSVRPNGSSLGTGASLERGYASSAAGQMTGFPVPRFGLLRPSGADKRRRRRVMLCSPFFEAVAIGVFLWMLAVLPQVPVKAPENVTVVPLFAPAAPAPPEPMPKPVRVHIPARVVHQPPRIQIPQVSLTTPQPPVVHEHELVMPKQPEIVTAPMPAAPLPKLEVIHPKSFSQGSSAKPTVKLPIHKVQTGGFGDPQGLPGHAEGGSKGNVPKLGSFDLPTGPGQGNGSGGAGGVRGVVASAGFGSGMAVDPAASSGRGPVQSSGFGNAEVGRNASRKEGQAGVPAFVPVEILSKPQPIYPAEARKLHIEGEVLLSVVFESSGNLQVQRVISGLGHGMDQAAVRAAEGIRFKPARRDGQAVDSEATVHIIFQLAY